MIRVSNHLLIFLKKLPGTSQNCPLEIVDDRGEGIRKAIFTPDREGDSVIVLILAKGRETTMKVGSNYITCKSDVDYAGQFISEYDEKHS